MRKEEYEQPTVESIEVCLEGAICTDSNGSGTGNEGFGGNTEEP